MMIKYLLILLSIPCLCFGPPSGEECRKQLKAYCHSVSLKEAPSGKQVYFIHYEMFTVARPGKGGEDSRVEVRASLGKNIMFYESNYVSMYRDSNEVYTVIHPQKLIVRSFSDKTADASFRKNHLSNALDTLIDDGTVKPCRAGTYQGEAVKIAELLLNPASVKKTGLERIVYYLNEQKQSIAGQEMYYTYSSPVLKREIRFHTVDFNYKEKLKARARDYVFDGSRLKTVFKGYQVQDNYKN